MEILNRKALHVNSLSVEVLEKIFDFCFCDPNTQRELQLTFPESRTAFDFALFNVCRLWREVLLGTSKFWRSISIVINERSSTDQIRTFLRDRLRLAGSRRVSFDLTQHDSNLGPLDYLPSILNALKERPVLFTQYYENFQHMEGIFIHIYRTIKPQPFQFLKALRLQGPDMTMHSKGNFHLPYLEVLDIEAWTYLLELLGLFRTENLNTLIFTGYSEFDLGQFMQCLQSFPTLVYL